MNDSFFQSGVVQEELEAIQECYTELLKMSSGLNEFNPQERLELKAFLLTLSDSEFINNPKFSNPF